MIDTTSANPRFDALRSALYHRERKSFFAKLDRSLTLLIVTFGAGVMGKVADVISIQSIWLEFGVVVCGSLQLVLNFSERANVHAYLQKKYFEKLAEMEAYGFNDPVAIRRWCAELAELCSDEPTQLRALDAVIFNQALDALATCDEERQTYRQNVAWWQYLLRHVLAFHNANFHGTPAQDTSIGLLPRKPPMRKRWRSRGS